MIIFTNALTKSFFFFSFPKQIFYLRQKLELGFILIKCKNERMIIIWILGATGQMSGTLHFWLWSEGGFGILLSSEPLKGQGHATRRERRRARIHNMAHGVDGKVKVWATVSPAFPSQLPLLGCELARLQTWSCLSGTIISSTYFIYILILAQKNYHRFKSRKSELSKNRLNFYNSWKSQALGVQFM